MTKYELALVVNAKLEDEERLATVEKAKEYITRSTTSSSLTLRHPLRLRSRNTFASWRMLSDIYA